MAEQINAAPIFNISYSGTRIEELLRLAETSLQPGANVDNFSSGTAPGGTVLTATGFGNCIWEPLAALQIDDINSLAKLNNLLIDATLGRASDFEVSGAVSTHESSYDHSHIPSVGQKAALDAASSPNNANPFVTFNDLSSGTVSSVAITGTNGIQVVSGSPITSSGTIVLSLDNSALSLGSAANAETTDFATAAQGSKADTAVQSSDINTLSALNAIITDANLGDVSAFEASGAVSTHESSYEHSLIPTLDQKAALDGASSPDSTNVFATLNDISAAGGGTVLSVGITGTNGIEVVSGSPITSSGSIELSINQTTLETTLGLGSAAYSDSSAFEASGVVSTHESSYEHSLIPTLDQKAALDGASSPDSTNVFATLNDLNDGTVTSITVTGTNGITVNGNSIENDSPVVVSTITDSGTFEIGLDPLLLASALSLGSAANAETTDFATAAQGSKADTALQPGDLSTVGDLNALLSEDVVVTSQDNTWEGHQTFKAVTETVDLNATTSITNANGTILVFNLTGNVSLTDNLLSGQTVTVHILNGSSYSVSFPMTSWVSGSAPTLTTSDVITFWKVGTTLYANYIGSTD